MREMRGQEICFTTNRLFHAQCDMLRCPVESTFISDPYRPRLQKLCHYIFITFAVKHYYISVFIFKTCDPRNSPDQNRQQTVTWIKWLLINYSIVLCAKPYTVLLADAFVRLTVRLVTKGSISLKESLSTSLFHNIHLANFWNFKSLISVSIESYQLSDSDCLRILRGLTSTLCQTAARHRPGDLMLTIKPVSFNLLISL